MNETEKLESILIKTIQELDIEHVKISFDDHANKRVELTVRLKTFPRVIEYIRSSEFKNIDVKA